MKFFKLFQMRLPAWADWLALALMSIAAPAIAAYIHSACVFHSGYRLYNAEIGGAYFHGTRTGDELSFQTVFAWIGGFGVPAIPTFLVLLRFKKRALYCWMVWSGCIVLWTYLFFANEIAIH